MSSPIAPEQDPRIARFIQRAKAAGYTDAEIQAYLDSVRQRELGGIAAGANVGEPPITVRDLGRSFAQGATFGWADELYGAGAALIPGGQGYTEARDAVRENDRRFREAHPVAAGMADFAGGVATSLLPAGAAMRGVSLASKAPGVARAVGLGAAAGAAAGAGYSEDSTAAGVATDAAIGSVAGGAGAGVLSGLGRIGSAIYQRLRARNVPHKVAVERTLEQLAKAIDETPGGEAAVRQTLDELEAMRPGQTVLADVAPSLQRWADWAAIESPRVTDEAEEFLTRRAAGAGSRLADAAERASGQAPIDARSARRVAQQELRALGQEVYGPLRERGDAVSSEAIEEILQRPEIAEIAASLRRRAAAGGRVEYVPIVEKVNTPNGYTWQRTGVFPDFDLLQRLKIRLDGRAKNLRQTGYAGEAIEIEAARDQLVQAMEEVVPGYKIANARYGAKLAQVRAFTEGYRALDMDAAAIAEQMAAVRKQGGSEAVKAFRHGLMDRLVTRLRSVRQGRDAATQIIDAGPEIEARLRAAFPSDAEFRAFLREAKVERIFARTGQRIGRGSQTAPRQAMQKIAREGQAELGLVQAGATGGATGMAMAAGQRLLAGANDMPELMAQQMGRRLLTPGAARPALDEIALARLNILDRIRRRAGIRTAAPIATGSIFGRLAGLMGE